MKSKGLLLTFFLITVLLITACSLGGSGGSGGGGGLPAPVKLTAIENSPTNISLTWTAVSGAVKYKVYFSVTATGQFMYRDETEEHNYLVSDLVPNNDYYFRVSSVDVNGIEGPQSTYVVCKTRGISVTDISINKASINLTVGGTEKLNVIVMPSNASNKSVEWSSSNRNVASVSLDGLVTGVSAGSATIIAKTVDGGYDDSCTVTVSTAPVPVIGVYLNKSSTALLAGSSETLIVTVLPVNATNKNVTWSSSAPAVASVTSSGAVTGLSAGTSIITVRTSDGYYTDSCTVSVSAVVVPVTGVSLNKTSASIIVGNFETLTATITPANATNQNLIWTSSAPDIATVTNGVVIGVSAGNAVITVSTVDGNKTVACAVTVTAPIPVNSVSLSYSSYGLYVGDSLTLTATVNPTNATNKAVTWSSSNIVVATVSENGVVNAVSAGYATITVTTSDGGKTAACLVTVYPISVTGVTLNKTSASLLVGGTETLVATVSPSNATNKDVSWSSNNTAVATVSSTGVVTAVSAGNATITVTTSGYGYKAYCDVTVNATNVPVTGVTLNKSSTALTVGTSETLTPTVAPSNATNQNVTWTTSNSSITTVTNGVVTGAAVGSATITATTVDGGKTAACVVTVNAANVLVTGVTLNKSSTALTVGTSETLTAIIVPSNATNKSIIWSSSNSNVASVSVNGTVTAISKGTVTITVTTMDGNISATCAVIVNSSESVPSNFVYIEGGKFIMGSPSDEPNRYYEEGPQHQVTVSAFYMGKYEVTQAEYESVMGTNPSYYKGSNLPVGYVSWYDAVEYCNRLSQREGLTLVYQGSGDNITCNWSANGYRLPTEAEWEYACRAGTTTAYNTGSTISTNTGWYSSNSNGTTHPVGQKTPNAWGLYDMHGNVWEWCWDRYGYYSSVAQTNPRGPVSGSWRVIRGGSLSCDERLLLRSAFRTYSNFGNFDNGFRVVRS
jgi:uncharacterized protein YjdB